MKRKSDMRRVVMRAVLAAVLLQAVPVAGQNLSRAEYIERYRGIAVEHAEKYGIPASVKMAQGILESGDGNGTLARRGNTHFNIKVKASDNWRGEVVYHDDDAPNEPFRAYSSPEESWIDHSEYLDTQPRYDSLFRYAANDYRSWARGLKNAGYATDPLYAEKLVRIIEENELWRLDGGVALAMEPAVPVRREPVVAAVEQGSGLIDPDRFVIVMRRKQR
ncbi:MAG: glucosaminidase domain-containing protein [Alistipes sp.]|jgi:flagellum-specific peptidoglycan hydrolase FlgJ|nr:glucosaminidase domain-containing protein [Alistipes sp.]